MPKDATYHESAVIYNEEMAEFAGSLAERDDIKDPEVKRWCRGIAKQHGFHLEQHQMALERLQKTQKKGPKNRDKPARKGGKHRGRRGRPRTISTEIGREKSIVDEQAEYAARAEALEQSSAAPMDASPVDADPRSEQDAKPIQVGVDTALPADRSDDTTNEKQEASV